MVPAVRHIPQSNKPNFKEEFVRFSNVKCSNVHISLTPLPSHIRVDAKVCAELPCSVTSTLIINPLDPLVRAVLCCDRFGHNRYNT